MKETLMEVPEPEESGLGVPDHAPDDPEDDREAHRIFFCVWMVEAAVNRGGFSHYLTSDPAGTLPFVAGALDAIGAPLTAGICRRAIECAFPDGLSPVSSGTSSSAARLTAAALEQLEKLDAEFREHPEDLTHLLGAYVMAHPEDFATLPELE